MALLVTTTTNLNRIIGGQRKRQSGRFFGLLELFETSYISNAGAFERDSTTLEGARAREALPARITAKAMESEPRIAPAHAPIVPPHWVVAMRLALVSFMTTAW